MYHIRKYKPSDRERLRYIAKETAWKSYRKTEKRAEAVAILYNDYFTQYEPENIFVAVNDDDQPVGYVICSSNYRQFVDKTENELLPKAVKVYPPIRLVHIGLMQTLKGIKLPERRVHFHINLLPEAQRQGLGTALLDALRAHLYRNGVAYMAACGVNRYAGSYQFYKKYGFVTYRNLMGGRATLGIMSKENKNG
ncbi:MAG: GNAT family N-acetyltransferase [Eubacterium sp.]|nr:GNAT family N-acetyltransferase [Eubacterium sp.]